MEKGNITILVVDDDLDILEGFRSMLQSEGYKVDTASSGADAIEQTRSKRYELALFDIKLPDMEGTELLKRVHATTPQMMKVMVTGHASLNNAIDSLNLGADAYVMKPVNPTRLLEIVEAKLTEQDAASRLTEDEVADWVNRRLQKLDQTLHP